MSEVDAARLEAQKLAAARAALDVVEPGAVIGVGTGSTAAHFVRELARSGIPVAGAVPSSERTRRLLLEHGIEVVELPDIGRLPLYVDGADVADEQLRLVKGGGGALTREKIVACSSDLFVCIVDESKLVDRLRTQPFPVEVIPMAVVHVSRRLARLGGHAIVREGFTTDNGNIVLDVSGLDLVDPAATERVVCGIVGVVSSGLFARRPADVLLVGQTDAVRRIERPRLADLDDWS